MVKAAEWGRKKRRKGHLCILVTFDQLSRLFVPFTNRLVWYLCRFHTGLYLTITQPPQSSSHTFAFTLMLTIKWLLWIFCFLPYTETAASLTEPNAAVCVQYLWYAVTDRDEWFPHFLVMKWPQWLATGPKRSPFFPFHFVNLLIEWSKGLGSNAAEWKS